MDIKTSTEALCQITGSPVEVSSRNNRLIAHWPQWREPISSKLALAGALEHETNSVEEVRVTPTTFTIVLVLPEKPEDETPKIILPQEPKLA